MFGEYSAHMFGFRLFGGEAFGGSLSEATVLADSWDGRWYVDLAALLFGIFGV